MLRSPAYGVIVVEHRDRLAQAGSRAGPAAPAHPDALVNTDPYGGRRLRFRAIVFDLDGTLIDTETPWYRAARELYSQHGATLRYEDWARGIGTATEVFDPLAHLEALGGRPLDRPALAHAYRSRVEGMLAGEPLRPGIPELLAEATRRGVRLGLASSSNRAWVTARLQPFGLLPRFETVCTRDDVARVKPDPALYLLAAERLEVTPSETLAIEDSPHGATAARRAGMACVAVPNPTTGPLAFPAGVVRLETLAGVDLETLFGLFGG